MKFRAHIGYTLTDSMKTVMEVESKQDIIDHLNKWYKTIGTQIMEIRFEYACYDKRIDWDTYYVAIRLKWQRKFQIGGYTNGVID